MKTAAKVFIWIGMILQFFLVYPIVVGIFALKKLDFAANESELKTWGILAAFFCSPIGGILMLSMKPDQIGVNCTPGGCRPITTQKVVVEKQYRNDNDKKRFRAKTAVIVLMAMYTCLLVLATVFSGILLCWRDELNFIPLVVSCLQIVVIFFSFFAINSKTLLKDVNFCLAATTFLAASQTFFSLFYNIFELYGKNEWLWSIFGTSTGALIFSIISLVVSIKTKQGTLNCKIVKTKTVVTINHMEVELAEAKRLLDTNVITQEEHDRIRSSIISKYYF